MLVWTFLLSRKFEVKYPHKYCGFVTHHPVCGHIEVGELEAFIKAEVKVTPFLLLLFFHCLVQVVPYL